MKKYLIIRFSSIGDIVLTSPVVRCLKNDDPSVEVHYLTKESHSEIVSSNPNIDKVYTIKKEIDEVVSALKGEKYTFIVDLHHNLRTLRLKKKLGIPSASFPKLNRQKFLLTTFKVDKMPDLHVVDRYFEAVQLLHVKNDFNGLDYFISELDHVDLKAYDINAPYVAFCIGAQFATKRLPREKILALVRKLKSTIILLGGKDDMEVGKYIASKVDHVINLCGELTINQSASVLQQSAKVITHDTGLMHIASAFNKPIISIWGNTVPSLGMYPYMPQKPDQYSIHQVAGLSCRPCSKIGYQKCPKKHFNCMQEQDLSAIAKSAELD